MSLNGAANVSVKGNDYRIRFRYISKDEAINLLKNCDLKEKVWAYNIIKMDKKLHVFKIYINIYERITALGDTETASHKSPWNK